LEIETKKLKDKIIYNFFNPLKISGILINLNLLFRKSSRKTLLSHNYSLRISKDSVENIQNISSNPNP